MARKLDLDKTGLEFTRNWFLNRNHSTFVEYIHPAWAGKPITYLELGVFEGMSMSWMLQHILTHNDARAVGVDPWLMTSELDAEMMDEVHGRAAKNVRLGENTYCHSAGQWKCLLIQANSIEALTRMNKRGGFAGITKGSVDLCMIDGDHNSGAVLDDARKALPLMRRGGWMLFDDVENAVKKADHVKQDLELWLSEQSDRSKQIWKHRYMEAFEVL